MRKRFLSGLLALIMTISLFQSAIISASADVVEDRAFTIDVTTEGLSEVTGSDKRIDTKTNPATGKCEQYTVIDDIIEVKVAVDVTGSETFAGYDFTFGYDTRYFKLLTEDVEDFSEPDEKGVCYVTGKAVAPSSSLFKDGMVVATYRFKTLYTNLATADNGYTQSDVLDNKFTVTGHIAVTQTEALNGNATELNTEKFVEILLLNFDEDAVVLNPDSTYDTEKHASFAIDSSLMPRDGKVEFVWEESDGTHTCSWNKNGQKNVPTFTEAGVYTIKYRVTAEGYWTIPQGSEYYTAIYTVKPKDINVTADSVASTVENDLSALTYKYEPELYSDDTFTGALATTADKDRTGNYDITIGTLTAGSNYNIVFTAATYTVEEKGIQEITIDRSLMEAVYGDEPVTRTAKLKVGNGAITYESSNPNVATVDEKTGKVTFVGAGNATVTVKAAETSTYAPAQTSYEVSVAKQVVKSPVISNLVYTGSLQVPAVPESELYTVLSNVGGTDVGTYKVALELVDSNNYTWDNDGFRVTTLYYNISKAGNVITDIYYTYGEKDEDGNDIRVTKWTYGATAPTLVVKALNGTIDTNATVYAGVDGTKHAKMPQYMPTAVGNYAVTVTVPEGANYAGATASTRFTIQAKPIKDTVATISVTGETEPGSGETAYDRTEKAVTVTELKDGEYILEEGLDYIVISGDTASKAGTQKLVLKGIGNYTGTKTIEWKIVPLSLEGASVTLVKELTYNGKEQEMKVQVVLNNMILIEGEDYVLVDNKQTNAGDSYELTVKGIGTYADSSKTGVVWSIAKKDVRIDGATQSYKQGAKDIAFVVKPETADPTEGYTVEYSSDGTAWTEEAPADPGVYQVKVTHEADDNHNTYSKVITEGLAILEGDPQNLQFENPHIDVTYPANVFVNTLTGAEGEVTFTSSNTAVATVDPTTGSVTINSTGEVTITATAAAVGSKKETKKSYTVTVTPGTPNCTTATVIATYGDNKIGDYTITGTARIGGETISGSFRWKYPDSLIGNASPNLKYYTAIFTPDDLVKYSAVEFEAAVSVEKKTIKIKGMTVSDKSYDGTTNAEITNVEFEGLINGDTLAIGTNYTVSGNFIVPNCGVNKDVVALVTLYDTATRYSNYVLDSSVYLNAKGTIYGSEVDKYSENSGNGPFTKAITVDVPNIVGSNATVVLPEIPEGMEYGKPTPTGSITGNTLTFNTTSATSEVVLVPVTDPSGNIDDYTIVVTTNPYPVTIEGLEAPDALYHDVTYEPFKVFGTPSHEGTDYKEEEVVYHFFGTGDTNYPVSNDAETSEMPTDPGTYRVYVTDMSGNKSECIDFTIGHKAATVTFYSNGSYFKQVKTECCSTVEKPETDPTYTGYKFCGWYADSACAEAWDFDTDTVSQNTTIYAKWIRDAYTVGGIVYEYGGTVPVANAKVSIAQGATILKTTTSNAKGEYSFTDVAPGTYNLIAEFNGTIKTELVTVGYNLFNQNLILPPANVNSLLTVKGNDTPKAVVGGLDEAAIELKDSEAEKAEQNNCILVGVEIEMTVQAKDEIEISAADTTQIRAVAQQYLDEGDNTTTHEFEFFDIGVEKTVSTTSDEGTNVETNKIINTENGAAGKVFEIVIPYNLTNISNFKVYRYHVDENGQGSAIMFTELSARPTDSSEYVDGTCFIDYANNLVYMYATKFSTYAFSYQTVAPTHGPSGASVGYAINLPDATEAGSVTSNTTTAAAGSNVTLTVKPGTDYELKALTVVDEDGNKIDLTQTSENVYKFKMPASDVTVTVEFKKDKELVFVDVAEGDYFYEAVYWAVDQGITTGVDDTHFKPFDITTRAQMVTFMWRVAGCPEPESYETPFTDISPDDYYYKAVLFGYQNGYIKGTSPTTFSPNMTVTRGQACAFLARLAGVADFTEGYTCPFTDVTTKDYYYNAVTWAVANNVTKGVNDEGTLFAPDNDCLRGQVVTMLYRYYGDSADAGKTGEY